MARVVSITGFGRIGTVPTVTAPQPEGIPMRARAERDDRMAGITRLPRNV
jgi:hypothetical protein